MKNYSEWTEDDIAALLDKVPEQPGFEYKSADALREIPPRPRAEIVTAAEDALKNAADERDLLRRLGGLQGKSGRSRGEVIAELSKDISAVANASGGVFIYGLREENLLPVEIDGFAIDPAARDVQPDWLEQVIRSSIKPKAPEVLIYPIATPTHRPGQRVYLVKVEQSARGCQAKDGRYYRRHSFQNQQMEDYEIRDLMNRATAAEVRLVVGRVAAPEAPGRYSLIVRLGNEGPIRVRDWMVELHVPADLIVHETLANKGIYFERVLFEVAGTRYPVTTWRFSNTGDPLFPRSPLFPKNGVDLLNLGGRRVDYQLNLRTREAARAGRCNIEWVVYADDLPPQTGSISPEALKSLDEEQ